MMYWANPSVIRLTGDADPIEFIQKKARERTLSPGEVKDGQIVIRPIMTYYFTYDHRVINGAEAARFISSLTQSLENPSTLLT